MNQIHNARAAVGKTYDYIKHNPVVAVATAAGATGGLVLGGPAGAVGGAAVGAGAGKLITDRVKRD